MVAKNLIFIDSRVADYQSLIADLGDDFRWVLLDETRDGVEQMTSALSAYRNLDSIQVISHGSTGSLYLGSTVLSSNNLESYTEQLQAIGSSLTDSGDLLLYGCNVAQGDVGRLFIDSLASIMQADVAASNNLTGAIAYGSDWNLESATGLIEAIALEQNNWSGQLSLPSDDIVSHFQSDGYYSTFGYFSKAAYHLSTLEQRNHEDSTFDANVIYQGSGDNFVKPYSEEAFSWVSNRFDVLNPVDISHATSGVFSGIIDDDPWYWGDDGVYYSENAAAFFARCGDSVVVSFRGTNDNDVDSDWLDFTTGDEKNWVDMSGHYDELRVFVNAVDDYVKNNNITNVYVTGHSLGGGMALGYMGEHPLGVNKTLDGSIINYEAVTFAAPGYYKFGSLDSRVMCIEIDGDPVPDIKYHQGYIVSMDVAGLISGETGSSYSGADFHSMDLYLEAAKTLDSQLPNTENVSSTELHGFQLDMFSSIDYGLEVSLKAEEIVGDESFTWKPIIAPNYVIAEMDDTLADTGNIGQTDYFLGGAGQDTLGGAGLLTNAGNGVLVGGDGDDIYLVDDVRDKIIEKYNAGYDSVRSEVSYVLSENIEKLSLVQDSGWFWFDININGTGNSENNLIDGNDGSNTLRGLLGNDTLISGLGNDVLEGGEGEDLLVALDGNDTLKGGNDSDFYQISRVENDLPGSVPTYYLVDSGGANDIINISDIMATVDLESIADLNFKIDGNDLWVDLDIDGLIDDNDDGRLIISQEGAAGSAIESLRLIDDNSNYITGYISLPSIYGAVASYNDSNWHRVSLSSVMGQYGELAVNSSGSVVFDNTGSTGGGTTGGTTSGVVVKNQHPSTTEYLETSGNFGAITLPNLFDYYWTTEYVNGKYGSIDCNMENGSWNYYVDDTIPAIKKIDIGESLSDIIKIGGNIVHVYWDNGVYQHKTISTWSRSVSISILGNNLEDDDFSGTNGNDYLYGNTGDDILSGLEGNDTLAGGYGNDSMYGGAGDDSVSVTGVIGSYQSKFFDGGTGVDTMNIDGVGGSSYGIQYNYSVTYSPYSFAIAAGSDFDYITKIISGQTTFNITDIITFDITYTGVDLINLKGTSESDLLICQGIGGSYDGRSGIDTFYADWSSSVGSITWKNTGTAVTIEGAVISNVEQILIRTGSGNDTLSNINVSTDDTFLTGAGNDTIFISGIANKYHLVTVDGGADADTLNVDCVGGGIYGVSYNYTLYSGDDFYTITQAIAGKASFYISDSNTLDVNYRNIEKINLKGTPKADLLIAQGAGGSYDGRDGIDTFYADWGNSTTAINWTNTGATATVNGYIISGVEQLLIRTGSGNDTLSNINVSTDDTFLTGAGNDSISVGGIANKYHLVTVDGGAGADILNIDCVGGSVYGISYDYTLYSGDDFYTITQAIAGKTSFYISDSNTLDVNYTDVEKINLKGTPQADLLILQGSGGSYDGRGGTDTFYADWGSSSNPIIWTNTGVATTVNGGTISNVEQLLVRTGSGSDSLSNLTATTDDTFLTGLGNDYINAGLGNDSIVAGAGNDTLIGGAGIDTLNGGTGNDTYYTDSIYDVLVESPDTVSGGVDAILSTVSIALGTAFENLTLSGGNAINGTGNALANLLTGNSADNILNGGLGNDTMSGGSGNDTYVVDSINDVVKELLNAGVDIIKSSVSYTIANNIEQLTLTGTAVINATGNTVANTLTGNASANILNGLAGADSLIGGGGADTLNGGAGADTMAGGLGNDVYIVDNTADKVSELSAAGTDTVKSSVNYTLPVNFEKLLLTGNAPLLGQGNSLANTITGNTGNNLLDGGSGKDVIIGDLGNDTLLGRTGQDNLTGGEGADVFYYTDLTDSGVASTTWDIITDFSSLQGDKIDLSMLDANIGISGNDAFSYIGSAALSGPGKVNFTYDAATKIGTLAASIDNDAAAEFILKLVGVSSLSVTDIIL